MWIKRTDREPEKSALYRIKYYLNDTNDACAEGEEIYYSGIGWNKQGYGQFVAYWWEVKKRRKPLKR